MTIEHELSRIATALESIAANGGSAPVTAATAPAQTRGRKAKGETNGVADPAPTPAPVSPVVEEEDPFSTTAPAAPAAPALTLDHVRTSLIAAGKRLNSPEKARGILKTHGGVDALAGLPEAKWATVKAAADAAGV